MSPRRGLWIGIVLLMATLITAPALWSAWNSWRLGTVGVETVAEVTETQAIPEEHPTRFFLSYRLPVDADPERRVFPAEVDRATYDEAVASHQIAATYLAGSPGANQVAGQVTNSLVLWLVVLADLALLVILGLALKFGERKERPLVLLATADVVRCRPGFAVDEVDPAQGEFVVRGDVIAIGEGEITVHVGLDKEVRVVLGEYRNPVGHQQPAEIHGRRFTP